MPVFDLGKILEEAHREEYAEFDNPHEFATAEQKEQRFHRLFAAGNCSGKSECSDDKIYSILQQVQI